MSQGLGGVEVEFGPEESAVTFEMSCYGMMVAQDPVREGVSVGGDMAAGADFSFKDRD